MGKGWIFLYFFNKALILMTVYGIRNCDTMKKAFAWLEAHGIPYTFHDYKKQGIDEERLTRWVDQVGWETLLNKRGATWRQLSPEEQQRIISPARAIALMREKTSVIKRPLIEQQGQVLVLGFEASAYAEKIRS